MSLPQKGSKTRQALRWLPQDQLPGLRTACPGADQSVETTTLKGHNWEADECSVEILPWDVQVKPLSLRTQCSSLGNSPHLSPPLLQARFPCLSLSPKLQGPFLASVTCFLSLFLLWLTSCTSVTFDINILLELEKKCLKLIK